MRSPHQRGWRLEEVQRQPAACGPSFALRCGLGRRLRRPQKRRLLPCTSRPSRPSIHPAQERSKDPAQLLRDSCASEIEGCGSGRLLLSALGVCGLGLAGWRVCVRRRSWRVVPASPRRSWPPRRATALFPARSRSYLPVHGRAQQQQQQDPPHDLASPTDF